MNRLLIKSCILLLLIHSTKIGVYASDNAQREEKIIANNIGESCRNSLNGVSTCSYSDGKKKQLVYLQKKNDGSIIGWFFKDGKKVGISNAADLYRIANIDHITNHDLTNFPQNQVYLPWLSGMMLKTIQNNEVCTVSCTFSHQKPLTFHLAQDTSNNIVGGIFNGNSSTYNFFIYNAPELWEKMRIKIKKKVESSSKYTRNDGTDILLVDRKKDQDATIYTCSIPSEDATKASKTMIIKKTGKELSGWVEESRSGEANEIIKIPIYPNKVLLKHILAQLKKQVDSVRASKKARLGSSNQ